MSAILIFGAGKIGSLVACLLSECEEYVVHIADVNLQNSDITRLLERCTNIHTLQADISEHAKIKAYIEQHNIQAIISCLPYYINIEVAELAKRYSTHYFDLTEDTAVTQVVKAIAKNATTAFVPQCGLAPGFISIVANSLMQAFSELDFAKLRVGALPQNANNSLHYALTWSTEGVINEYGNPCHGIECGEPILLHPLEGLEHIQLDGLYYEAFNTSGGLGSLAELYQGKINTLNYKTIRYPGHCHKMRVLMNDLKLNQDRLTLQRILENAVPRTDQDIVLVYVSVTGKINNNYVEKNYVKKMYPRVIAELPWTAIQITTASSLCVIVDLVLNAAEPYQGLVLQEQFKLKDFLANRFSAIYQ